MTEIYNGITGSEIDIELNDDMRALYGQMLGGKGVRPSTPKAAKTEADLLKEADDLFNQVLFQAPRSPIGFYSTVENALDAIKQNKGTAEQFKAMLLKNGAKQAELDGMGWDEFAKANPNPTKADIQEWIDENKVEVEEVIKGKTVSRKDLEEKGFIFSTNEEGQVVITSPSEDAYGFISIAADNERDAIDSVIDFSDTPLSEPSDTKYFQYQLQGGENYKEVLLTMPSREQSWKNIDDFKQSMRDKYGNGWKDKMSKNESDSFESFVNGEARRPKETFKSSHFDEPNILAHVRFNERNVNGERVLFIEEFQAVKGQEWQKLKKLIEEGKATKADIDRFEFLDKNFPSLLSR